MADCSEGETASGGELAVGIASSIGAFTQAEWDSLTGTTRGDPAGYNPFLSYAFLTSLEESGCAVPRTGWQGQHVRLEDASGALLGAVPCYAKSHSQGEYVFDHGWADAFERAGGNYYPKLQAAIPFTPVTGPRLLARKGAKPDITRAALAAGLKAVTEKLGVSSTHVTFATGDDAAILERAGFLRRTDQQFHFFNHGYGSYADFLDTLASRKRKALKKERREALADGISIDWLTGSDLTEKAWDAFFAFYMDTGGRKWGRPYLNRKFFSLIGERMADDVLLVMAKRGGRHIAGAINFIGSDALYGRNWGCIEDHPYPAFRGLLPPGHRLRDRQGTEGGRGRRARRAQAGARLYACHHAVGPLHRAPRLAPRHCRLSPARAPRGGACAGISGRARAVPARRAAGTGLIARRGKPDRGRAKPARNNRSRPT